ncbi:PLASMODESMATA CALLOSE-BINDING PROTEIN 4-like isoform X1 [Haliotis rufescens]|uniref:PLASMODESMATA CALLOSE-BINDING PROTEIN 4-like isoform X1 n=1 Tax=Haliotis rufescens TaxID=6454 RepID=UPI00201E83B9|nr:PLASMODESMATA CALLOSE-BINDING PROTEIN 4-like isoform X1 [Haliotis rufescens]
MAIISCSLYVLGLVMIVGVAADIKLQTEETVAQGAASYIRALCDCGATETNLIGPDGKIVFTCANKSHCLRNRDGYVMDCMSSNETTLAFVILNFQAIDAGTWSLRCCHNETMSTIETAPETTTPSTATPSTATPSTATPSTATPSTATVTPQSSKSCSGLAKSTAYTLHMACVVLARWFVC